MTMYKKTDITHSTKKSAEDYQKVIDEQGKALYKLNQRIREKTSENKKMRHEMGHLRNLLKLSNRSNFFIKDIQKFRNIVIASLRYALGRRTSIVIVVADFIKENQQLLDEKSKQIMLNDLKKYFESNTSNGKEQDKAYQIWLDLKEWLENIEVGISDK